MVVSDVDGGSGHSRARTFQENEIGPRELCGVLGVFEGTQGDESWRRALEDRPG